MKNTCEDAKTKEQRVALIQVGYRWTRIIVGPIDTNTTYFVLLRDRGDTEKIVVPFHQTFDLFV